MRTNVTVTIETDKLTLARKRGLNLSEILQKSINAVLFDTSIESLDYEKAKVRIKELTNEITERQAEINGLSQVVNAYENKQLHLEQERLEKQKADLEALSKCAECGGFIREGTGTKFAIGNICHSCLLTVKGKLAIWEKREPQNNT